jgi:hypothetical protein
MNRRGAGLFLLALAWRLFFAFPPAAPEADAADYLRLAQGLRAGSGYVDAAGHPTAFRPPLYPLMLSLTGPDARVAVALQSALGAANCLLAVALVSRWLPGPAPWLAGLLLAIDPVHASASSRLLSEILYQTLFLLSLLALDEGRSPRRALLSGLLSGLSLLSRSAALPVLLVMLIVWAWHSGLRPKAGALFLAGVGLAVSPWLARNALVMGAPVLTTQGGITLYSSYRPPQGRIFGVLIADDEVVSAQAKGEVAADRRLTRAALGEAAAHPRRTLRLAFLKVAFLWMPIDWEIRHPAGLLSPAYLFAIPLALWTLATRPRSFHPAPLVLLAITLFSAIVYGSPRLRLPYDPLVYGLASGVVAANLRRPALWLWAAACLALGLAGGLPRRAARAVARALGWW